MWKTGKKTELCCPYNNFSKTNWGDSIVVRKGKMDLVLTTGGGGGSSSSSSSRRAACF